MIAGRLVAFSMYTSAEQLAVATCTASTAGTIGWLVGRAAEFLA